MTEAVITCGDDRRARVRLDAGPKVLFELKIVRSEHRGSDPTYELVTDYADKDMLVVATLLAQLAVSMGSWATQNTTTVTKTGEAPQWPTI